MAKLTAKPAWTAKRVNTKTGVGLIHSDDGSKPNTI